MSRWQIAFFERLTRMPGPGRADHPVFVRKQICLERCCRRCAITLHSVSKHTITLVSKTRCLLSFAWCKVSDRRLSVFLFLWCSKLYSQVKVSINNKCCSHKCTVTSTNMYEKSIIVYMYVQCYSTLWKCKIVELLFWVFLCVYVFSYLWLAQFVRLW